MAINKVLYKNCKFANFLAILSLLVCTQVAVQWDAGFKVSVGLQTRMEVNTKKINTTWLFVCDREADRYNLKKEREKISGKSMKKGYMSVCQLVPAVVAYLLGGGWVHLSHPRCSFLHDRAPLSPSPHLPMVTAPLPGLRPLHLMVPKGRGGVQSATLQRLLESFSVRWR